MDIPPDIHGILARYELLMLLRSLRAERFTGRLGMTSGEERVALYLHDGQPHYARSYALRHSFPAWLVRQRILPRETVKAVFKEASNTRSPFDELVVRQGHLTAVSLVATRQSLARYVLTFAFSLDPAAWEAWRSDAPPRDLFPMDLDPERAFFRFVAQRDDVDAQVTALKDRFERTITPTHVLAEREGSFRAVFGARDPIFDAVASGTSSVARLLAGGADTFQVIPRVFALHRTGLVRFAASEDPSASLQWADALGDLATAARIASRHGRRGAPSLDEGEEVPTGALPLQPGPPQAPTPSAQVAPDEPAPEVEPALEDEAPTPIADPRQVALSWLTEAETASHYGLLGVAHDSSNDEVRHAATLVRQRLERLRSAVGRPGDPDAASAVRAIAVRIDQAERTLTDARRRKLYNSSRGLSVPR